MGKTWGDDKLRELNRTAEEHAIAAHVDEALETYEISEGGKFAGGLPRLPVRHGRELTPRPDAGPPPSELPLYDQDLEVPENPVEIRTWGDITILPSRCGLCGTLFQNPPWDPEQGSLCSVCGATTKVSR